MKRSIKRLPKRTQEELAVLQELILSNLTNVRMIILYGSYARGKYVIWDETFDGYGSTYYQSDLDILVICDTKDATNAERHAREVIVPKYDKRMEGKRHPAPPSIIVENPTTINRAMRRKHYFFYEIIKDGILLYDDGTFQIGKPEKLPFREIKQYAEEEYAEDAAFDSACNKAIQQIEEKHYEAALLGDGMENVVKYGIACYKKRCKVLLAE